MEPIKTACGCISIPKSLKSKSLLVIPTSHKSFSPQNGVTSTSCTLLTICGKLFKSCEALNCCPLNCVGTPIPILIKSEGRNEN